MDIFKDKVHTNDFTMSYFRFGKGEKTLAVIPGLGVRSVLLSASAVAEEYRLMADDFMVYVFDRREDLPPSYSVYDMARDTVNAFIALGLHDVYLFGASQGGMISMLIAIEHPELIKKLVLGSTSSRMREEHYSTVEGWARLAEKGDGPGLYLAFGKEIYPPDVFENLKDELIAAGETVPDEDLRRFVILARGLKDFNVTEELHRIQCPVLVIGVYEDAVLDSDLTMEMAEKLESKPDFRLYMYIGYGHAAYDTAPDYRERIYRFFMQ